MLHLNVKFKKNPLWNQQGFVLITTVLFMQILSMLGLYALQMSYLEIKAAHASWQRFKLLQLADDALVKIEQNFSPSCLISLTPSAQLVTKPINWWQSFATCTGNLKVFQYYYVVELLGEDPCGYIQISPAKRIATYYRITLKGIMNDSQILLQSTIAVPSLSNFNCKENRHLVSLGRQMQRKLV